MAKSVADQLRALDEQRGKILGQAKEEALKRAQVAVDELNSLGFSYSLRSSNSRRGLRAGSRIGTRQVNPDRPCPICGFRTDPPHDARRHRGQPNKKVFTADELSGMGMRKV